MAQQTDPNDQAFATPPTFSEEFGICPQEKGLTKREYFAAMAMQGVLASPFEYDDVTKTALNFADSLIEELNKEK